MMKNFVEELRWRGLLQDIIPGTEELMLKEKVVGYIGFDPTADSLHIGSMSQILTLMRLQKAGHKPIALIGGATGMVGDPSGKSAERNLLDLETLNKNIEGQKKQLEKFLDFNASENGAELVNNLDWMQNISFIDFIRDVGKHLSVNYMMAKDSVKNRLENGMSFTEFSYQLLQAYDFYVLSESKNCKLQMGGSDQWGNITSGTELIRKKSGKEAYALTTQLIKKSDGGKFGKTESGNIWLDATKTSPYKFYQFWLNVSDDDAKNYIKFFTFIDQPTIENLINEHFKNAHLRLLQKTLAKEITLMVHGENEFDAALENSKILFEGNLEDFKKLSAATFQDIFSGVQQFEIPHEVLKNGIDILELLAVKSTVFPSKGEARKFIQGGGLSINKIKVERFDVKINSESLINNQFIVIQKGKKNYFLIKAI